MNKIQMYIKMLMDYKSLLLLYVFSLNMLKIMLKIIFYMTIENDFQNSVENPATIIWMSAKTKNKKEEELIPDLKGLETINPVK